MKKIILTFVLMVITCNIYAQLDGPRTYWALPKNLNILSAHAINGNANASLNNLTFVNPSIVAENNLYLLTYTRSQPIFGRTFYSTLFLPAGNINATVNIDPQGPAATSETFFQHGLGDIVWSNTINIFGAEGLMIKDFLRHENRTLVYFQSAITFPTGQYEEGNPINIGSNQFKYKFGLPMVQHLGKFVDGQRLSLEVFPSYTLIGDNKDFQNQKVNQKGMFTIESHLTKDITSKAFMSLDYSFMSGGGAEFISNDTGMVMKEQAAQNVHLIGATVNFNINDRLNLFLTHNQTFSSGNDNVSLDGTVTKLTLSWSFHDFQEKFKSFIESN
ncbi:transporter [Aestuariivivens sediminis]|uniref:transporter n=1 Tax=Aestuariivivens sediminis TaxID=2913557 RepID=UPI001F565E34|nr:transporter [Aestuariivivens sediminis]